jgi:AraC family transcriptional regulator of adaptative response / DNA-3-methyladenine glycosylase II
MPEAMSPPISHRLDLDREACLRALATRDERFDGRFFIGVRSTGIFCRPVCPARPRPENCSFFPSAAAAAEAGYRPCLRCRPEASPGSPAWLGTSATVVRAIRLVEQGALDDGSVGELAERLGIGERHMRRLFLEHVGASPVAVAQTRRVLFAKRLIDESSLPMHEIASASGFTSVRRFNDALRKTYGESPSSLRERRRNSQSRASAALCSTLTLRLPYRSPFDWDGMLGYFRIRATPGVEEIDGERYRRTFKLGEARGIIEVSRDEATRQLCANIQLADAPAPLIQVAARLRNLFDLQADPVEIGAHLKRDPLLRRSIERRPGLRVPGAWDGFELAVRAILGQQVSVKGATTLTGRLVAAHGEPIADPTGTSGALSFLFPLPEVIAEADVAKVGLPASRAGAIRALAAAVAAGKVELSTGVDLEHNLAALRALPGIGDWTAEYVAMRAMREPDAFPASDLGLRRALADENGVMPSVRELARMSEAWRPCRAYAAVALWSLDAG